MSPYRLGLCLLWTGCVLLTFGCTENKKEPTVPAVRRKAPVPQKAKALDGLFKAGQVELPKVLKDIHFGAGMSQLEAIAKPLAQGKPWQPSPESKVSFRSIFHTDNKTLRYLEVSLPQGSLGSLERLWGPPQNINIDGRERRQVWLDSNKTIQAIFKLEEKIDKVVFWPITNLSRLLGLKAQDKGASALALHLGKETTAVEALFQRRLNRPGGFAAWLSPLPYRTRPLTVFFDATEGRIHRISMRIEGDQSGRFEKTLVSDINRIWGSPKKVGTKRRVWTSPGALAVQLEMRKEEAASEGPRPPRFHLSLNAKPAPSDPKP